MFCFSDEKCFEIHLTDGIVQKFEVVEYDRKTYVLKLFEDYHRLKNALESWVAETKGKREQEYQCWIGNMVNSRYDCSNDGLSDFKQNFNGNKDSELCQSSSLYDKFGEFANEIKEHGENNNQTNFLNDCDKSKSEEKLEESNDLVDEMFLGNNEEHQLDFEVEADEKTFLKKKEKNKRKREKRKKKEQEVLQKVEDFGPSIYKCLDENTDEFSDFWTHKEKEFESHIKSQLKKGQVFVYQGQRYAIRKVPKNGLYYGQINDDNEPVGIGQFQSNNIKCFGYFKNGINGIGKWRELTTPNKSQGHGTIYFGMLKMGNRTVKAVCFLIIILNGTLEISKMVKSMVLEKCLILMVIAMKANGRMI